MIEHRNERDDELGLRGHNEDSESGVVIGGEFVDW